MQSSTIRFLSRSPVNILGSLGYAGLFVQCALLSSQVAGGEGSMDRVFGKAHDMSDSTRVEQGRHVHFGTEQSEQVLTERSAEIQSFQKSGRQYVDFIYETTHNELPERWKAHSVRIANTIVDVSNRYRLDPVFVLAVIKHESKFNPGALGAHGEIGLMQIKPSTAAGIIFRNGGDTPERQAAIKDLLEDPATNIRYGVAYLNSLREKFGGRTVQYLAAYNMGATRVRQHLRGGYEPRSYHDRVIAEYLALLTGPSSRRSRDIANLE